MIIGPNPVEREKKHWPTAANLSNTQGCEKMDELFHRSYYLLWTTCVKQRPILFIVLCVGLKKGELESLSLCKTNNIT